MADDTPAITKIDADAPEARSADLVAENIAQLRALFPELVTESAEGAAVNVEVLKQLVGDQTVTDAEEKYGLNWHGKRRARQLALSPSTGTLRPCPEESVDWDTTQNLMIEGDNLEVLKLLQKSYTGKVKLIYIDPPYNTGNDFVYPDNFQNSIRNYLEITGQIDGGDKNRSNTESSGRFHTDWLNMLYPRLQIARNLLQPDGAVFISIDDNEIGNLRALCDEIFGVENFVATIIWQKVFSPKNTAAYFSQDHDYILAYAKNKADWSPQLIPRSEEAIARYSNPDKDSRGPWMSGAIQARNYYSKGQYKVTSPSGKTFLNPRGTYWRVSEEKFAALDKDDRIWWGENGDGVPRIKRFLSDVKAGIVPQTLWKFETVGHTQEAKEELLRFVQFENTENILNSVKPTRLVRQILKVATTSASDDLVLDFFAGSGVTGHSVIAQNNEDGGNRRYILVQLPEPLPALEDDIRTIFDFTKSRLKNAAVSLEPTIQSKSSGDLGFRVFKLDSTNLQEWDTAPEDLDAALLAHAEHIKPGRSESDLLYELLLKLGLDLCVPLEERTVSAEGVAHRVHCVGGGALMACLSGSIPASAVEPLGRAICDWHRTLSPAGETTCVFRDSAFDDDVAKTNMAAILTQHGFTRVRSL